MSMSFDATVRVVADGSVIDLHGRIDRDAEAALDAAFEEATAAEATKVLLNFDGVDYINSTGIALIVSLLAKARASTIEMCAFGLTDHYTEIFEITRLADFVRIFPDEQTAVAPAVL